MEEKQLEKPSFQLLPISSIKKNDGEISGLPKNPRIIRDYTFQKLVKSIQDHPELLHARSVMVITRDGKYIVIGGNMRLSACKELGYKEIPCVVLDESTPVEKLRAYAVKDNVAFGEWDFEELANNWDSEKLEEWGLYVPQEEDEEEDDRPAKQEDTGILAITLTDDEQELWAECKSKLKIKTDKTAFLKLIMNFLTPAE